MNTQYDNMVKKNLGAQDNKLKDSIKIAGLL